MNKREFKKVIDAVGSSLYQEMMTAYYNVEGIDKEEVAKAIKDVLGATASARNNANIFFDRGMRSFSDHKEYAKAKKAFFKSLFDKIYADYNSSIDEALKKFNAALPSEVKEKNKQALAE